MSPQERQKPSRRLASEQKPLPISAVFMALRIPTSHCRNRTSFLKAFHRLRFIFLGLSHRLIFFCDFLMFFPSLTVPLIVTVTGSRTGPGDVSFDPPDTWAFPQGNQTPLLLSQLELRAEFCFSAARDRCFSHSAVSHFTCPGNAAHAACHGGTLTRLTACFMRHLVASSRSGREGKPRLTEFPLCGRYASEPFPVCCAFSRIHTALCSPQPTPADCSTSQGWLRANPV